MSYRDNSKALGAYSAYDIARILVRNPDEIVDLVTYEHICEKYGQGRPLCELPEHEHMAMLSLEAAASELLSLGYNNDQIETMISLLNESFDEINIRAKRPDMEAYGIKEQFLANSCAVAGYPYCGIPLVLHSPHYALKSYGFSMSNTRRIMEELTNKLAGKLIDKRSDMPYLLTVTVPNNRGSALHAEL